MSSQSALFFASLFDGPAPPLLWFPDFLPADRAAALFDTLVRRVPWESRSVNFGGRRVPVPRLVAWFGHEAYRYSGQTHLPAVMPEVLASLVPRIREEIAAALGAAPDFNSVLLNYYRDGQDSMSSHSDNEVQLGSEPVIASLSLGASRTFQLRSRIHRQRLSGQLTDGGLLVMHGRSQADWEHGVPKEPCAGARINLTFRHTAPLRPGPLRLQVSGASG